MDARTKKWKQTKEEYLECGREGDGVFAEEDDVVKKILEGNLRHLLRNHSTLQGKGPYWKGGKY